MAVKATISAVGSSGVGKYNTLVTKGATTTFVITHGLGSSSPIVQVYENFGDKNLVTVDTEIVDTNNIEINFSAFATDGSYKVIVHA